MERVLVTGGSGFIAGHVIETLESYGYEVVTNVRKNLRSIPSHLERADIYTTDMRDHAGIFSLVEQVDGVVHLAGLLGTRHIENPRDFYEVNLLGALNIFDAADTLQVPVVSIAVGNWFELNNYSNSKYAAEREALKYAIYKGTPINIVRGLNAFGPRQKIIGTGKIMPTFISKALVGLPLEVYGGRRGCGIMDMIYVKDLAGILVDVLEGTAMSTQRPGQVFEAGTGQGIPVWKIAELVVEQAGSSSQILEVGMRPGESQRSVVVAQRPYPYALTPFADALDETIAYYRGNYDRQRGDGDLQPE